ncbi:hypothetical protein RF819_02615 [Rhodoferax fermentans]|uniref:Uncharacterized protein n=1 Tax=Rhodoferax fermentans TaxID=28066 RepID=A0A1T1ANP2_RHOFE|nr:hypothetical protein RF819_02615 [Rhodoferax fermentans]
MRPCEFRGGPDDYRGVFISTGWGNVGLLMMPFIPIRSWVALAKFKCDTVGPWFAQSAEEIVKILHFEIPN